MRQVFFSFHYMRDVWRMPRSTRWGRNFRTQVGKIRNRASNVE